MSTIVATRMVANLATWRRPSTEDDGRSAAAPRRAARRWRRARRRVPASCATPSSAVGSSRTSGWSRPTWCAAFAAGRTSIRSALTRLHQEGLVSREHNRGARVRLISDREAVEIEQVRIALETADGAARRRAGDGAGDIGDLRGDGGGDAPARRGRRLDRLLGAQRAVPPAHLGDRRPPDRRQPAGDAEVAEHPVPVPHHAPPRPHHWSRCASTRPSSRRSPRATPMRARRRWPSTCSTSSPRCSGRSSTQHRQPLWSPP